MKDHQSKMRKNEAQAEGRAHLSPQKRGYRQIKDGQRQEISKVEGGRQWQAVSVPTDQIKEYLEILKGIIWGDKVY